MKTLYFMLIIFVSFKSFAINEIEQSYQEALTLIKSESIAPPIASYLMSEASTVAFKTYKDTRNQKAYLFSYISLLKKYYPSKSHQLDLVLNKISLKDKDKKESLKNVEKRFEMKKDSYKKALNSVYSASGSWEPTFPSYSPALLPHWGEQTTNFRFNYKDLFNKLPQIDINSKDFKKEIEFIKNIGSKNSTLRTKDQTDIAFFWAAGKGTITPPGMWTQIALKESLTIKDFYHQAFIMKQISNSLMDASIICWNLKYRYALLRPITAIRENSPNWESLLITPNFPSFTSGHSTFSATAAIILNSLFHSKNVSIESEGFSDRTYSNYITAAQDAGMSRIYGGIHYPVDNTHGLNIGFKIGCTVLQQKFNTKCKTN